MVSPATVAVSRFSDLMHSKNFASLKSFFYYFQNSNFRFTIRFFQKVSDKKLTSRIVKDMLAYSSLSQGKEFYSKETAIPNLFGGPSDYTVIYADSTV
jgi:hypothetical protein